MVSIIFSIHHACEVFIFVESTLRARASVSPSTAASSLPQTDFLRVKAGRMGLE